MIHQLTSLSEFCLDLLFPRRCVQCGVFGNFVCEKCLAKIKPIRTQVCPKCGKISDLGKWCSSCKGDPKLTGIVVGASYRTGPTKEMIHYLKYNGITQLAPRLADLLIDQLIDEDIPEGIIVTSVPLHKKKYLERGYNQAEMIAKIVAKKLGLTYQTVLIRTRYDKKSQVQLKGAERRANLAGAFKIAPRTDTRGRTILIVDDVSTTGTTLEECAKVLRVAGARRIYGLVVARG